MRVGPGRPPSRCRTGSGRLSEPRGAARARRARRAGAAAAAGVARAIPGQASRARCGRRRTPASWEPAPRSRWPRSGWPSAAALISTTPRRWPRPPPPPESRSRSAWTPPATPTVTRRCWPPPAVCAAAESRELPAIRVGRRWFEGRARAHGGRGAAAGAQPRTTARWPRSAESPGRRALTACAPLTHCAHDRSCRPGRAGDRSPELLRARLGPVRDRASGHARRPRAAAPVPADVHWAHFLVLVAVSQALVLLDNLRLDQADPADVAPGAPLGARARATRPRRWPPGRRWPRCRSSTCGGCASTRSCSPTCRSSRSPPGSSACPGTRS